MSKLMIGLVAALSISSLAGCKKKDGAGQTGDCAGAMDHVSQVEKASPRNAGIDAATVQKLTASSVQRCVDDKWAPDSINCFNAIKDDKGLMDCMGKLSADQQKKLNDALMAAMGTGGGGAMGSGGSAAPGSAAGSGSDAGSGSAAPAAGSAGGSAAAGSDAGSGSAAAGSGSAH